MHFEKHISKCSWSSRFRNWGRKKLEFLFHSVGKGFLFAWNCMPNSLLSWKRRGSALAHRAHKGGMTRLRGGMGWGWEAPAPFPEQSTGCGRGLCSLCLDRSPLTPNVCLLHSLNSTTATRCLSTLLWLYSRTLCDYIYICHITSAIFYDAWAVLPPL